MIDTKTNTFTRELPVRLSDAELQSYGKMLADKIGEQELAEARKKQSVAEWSGKIKAIENEVKRLADARSKGAELRPVECADRFNAGTVEVVRLDTHEIIDVRPADLRDRQLDLPELDEDDHVEAAGHVGPPEDDGGSMHTSTVGDAVYVGGESPDDDGETDEPAPFEGSEDHGESPSDNGESAADDGETRDNVIPISGMKKARNAKPKGSKPTKPKGSKR